MAVQRAEYKVVTIVGADPGGDYARRPEKRLSYLLNESLKDHAADGWVLDQVVGAGVSRAHLFLRRDVVQNNDRMVLIGQEFIPGILELVDFETETAEEAVQDVRINHPNDLTLLEEACVRWASAVETAEHIRTQMGLTQD